MSKIIGFSNDPFLRDRVQELIDKFNINLVFETGTYIGSTTKALAAMVKSVHTAEVNKGFYDEAVANLKGIPNITQYNQSSPEAITHFFNNVLGDKKRNILFYLDAHWGGTPLIDELKAIKASGTKPVIVIHDWKVPGKDFGYDSYDGQDYVFEWIEPYIKDIYGEDFTVSYNEKAAGSYRGVIFIEPTKQTDVKTKRKRTNKRSTK